MSFYYFFFSFSLQNYLLVNVFCLSSRQETAILCACSREKLGDINSIIISTFLILISGLYCKKWAPILHEKAQLKQKIKIPVTTKFIFFTTKIRNGWNSFLKHKNMTKNKMYKLYCLNTCAKNITSWSWITKLDLSIFFPTLYSFQFFLSEIFSFFECCTVFSLLFLLFNWWARKKEKRENENFFLQRTWQVDLIQSLLQ